MGARMFRKGLAVAVILLFIGVAFTSSINADIDKPIVETTQEEDITPTPIALVLQLMTKLRNHKDIQNVETEDDVLQIIEEDEELNSIYEQLSGNDCDCDDDSKLDWSFPAICLLLFPLVMIFTVAHLITGIDLPFYIMMEIGSILNCMWQL